MNLSPLNFSGLMARERMPLEDKKSGGHAIPISMYECSECGETYDREHEAEECCGGDDGPYSHDCPVCMTSCENPRDASDCCLWKDLDAAARWKMADAVDAGSTWVEQLQAWKERK